MKKKIKEANRISKRAQLRVKTGLKSGQWDECRSDADCTDIFYPVCIDNYCWQCRTNADCPSGNCMDGVCRIY